MQLCVAAVRQKHTSLLQALGMPSPLHHWRPAVWHLTPPAGAGTSGVAMPLVPGAAGIMPVQKLLAPPSRSFGCQASVPTFIYYWVDAGASPPLRRSGARPCLT